MPLFEIVVEETIETIQHRVVHIEAEDEDDAWYKVYTLDEGDTITKELVDTNGRIRENCDLVSIEEI